MNHFNFIPKLFFVKSVYVFKFESFIISNLKASNLIKFHNVF